MCLFIDFRYFVPANHVLNNIVIQVSILTRVEQLIERVA